MDFRFVPSNPVCFDKMSLWWVNRNMTAHQGSRVQQVCNQKGIMWWEPRGQIWMECRELQLSVRHAADQRRLWRACKGVQVLAPPGSRRGIWEEEVLSLSICLSIYHSTNNSGPLMRMKWDIFLYRSVLFVHLIS